MPHITEVSILCCLKSNPKSTLRFRNQKGNRTFSYRSKLAIVNSTTVSELLYSFRIFKISIEFFSVIPCAVTGIYPIGLPYKKFEKILGLDESTGGKVSWFYILITSLISLS